MSRRKLGSDEIELWKTVARSTDPLHPASKAKAERALPLVPSPPDDPSEPAPLQPFKVGAKARPTSRHRLVPAISDQLGQAPVNMDFKTYKHMRKGKLKPEARIDLHGMTLHQARPVLSRFILSAQSDGKRLVLVITGKGRVREDDGPIPTRVGILRHEVPRWLSAAPLAPCVQQITPASDRHGGSGAYYVYLRRR
ncbi:Smr/MutS family protein [Roseobacteraceae bacterium S113]